ncbi:MAG: DUF2235 domain-containing protein [Arenicellales bacterium]
MPKNIVVCCDGTGNEYGNENSNVLRLFGLIVRDGERQVGYYDPGLGTMSGIPALTKTVRAIDKTLGLAFAKGITSNIEDAYIYLMDRYEPGDRIFLFGFSRGAYTVRALAAMIHACGLLEKGSENMVPYASKMFKRPVDPNLRPGFRLTFSRECKPHFLGVWDTVSSVGWIYDQVKLPYTANNPDLSVLRHAVSIDERRCFFRQNLFGKGYAGQDIKEVWFAGVHSDVGGGYPEPESGLAKIPLTWMVREAVAAGLLIDEAVYAETLPSTSNDTFVAPDPLGPVHESLSGAWRIAEYFPKRYYNYELGRETWKIPMGETRRMREDCVVHASVVERMSGLRYRPPNLPGTYRVEE